MAGHLRKTAPENKPEAAGCVVNKVPENMPGEVVQNRMARAQVCSREPVDTPGTAAAGAVMSDKATEIDRDAAEKVVQEEGDSLDRKMVETWL
jgi:hypothetical protein